MFDDWHQGHVFVGQALGHIQTTRDFQRAGKAVGRAYKLFLKAGLTKEQAVTRIVSLSQTFGSLE